MNDELKLDRRRPPASVTNLGDTHRERNAPMGLAEERSHTLDEGGRFTAVNRPDILLAAMRSSKDRQLRAAGATYENIGDRRVYRGKHVLFRKLPLATNLCCFSDTNQFPEARIAEERRGRGSQCTLGPAHPTAEGYASPPDCADDKDREALRMLGCSGAHSAHACTVAAYEKSDLMRRRDASWGERDFSDCTR